MGSSREASLKALPASCCAFVYFMSCSISSEITGKPRFARANREKQTGTELACWLVEIKIPVVSW